MKKIFVINSGSSSLKFQLISFPKEEIICKGMFERIGEETMDYTIEYKKNGSC